MVHGHDWQAGLAPAYLTLGGGPRPATVLTIHNIAYQGSSPPACWGASTAPSSFSVNGLEYYNQIGFLKAGLFYSDRITTVSPTYAEEIQSPDGGYGLHGLLASRAGDLWGILNGVDYDVWSPDTDPHIVQRYDADHLDDKAASKSALQVEFRLDQRAEAPLFGVVSRLTPMKGFDLLLSAIPPWSNKGAQFALLGSGELAGGRLPGAGGAVPRTGRRLPGYDEPLSHRVQAGSDVILLPSRSEPCGLIQLYGLRYGTLAAGPPGGRAGRHRGRRSGLGDRPGRRRASCSTTPRWTSCCGPAAGRWPCGASLSAGARFSGRDGEGLLLDRLGAAVPGHVPLDLCG